jgi:hypothetical protein
MTIEEVMHQIFSQYPGCKQDTLQAVGKYLSRFDVDQISRLWKKLDADYDGEFAPDVGKFRRYAKVLGLAVNTDEECTEWVWVCRCCGMHQPKNTSGAKCSNCNQAKGFTFLVTKENAAVINRRLFGRPNGPEMWSEDPPHLFSLDYPAWIAKHPATGIAANATLDA